MYGVTEEMVGRSIAKVPVFCNKADLHNTTLSHAIRL